MSEKIKPCPHCGGDAVLDTDLDDPYDGKMTVFVRCEICGSRGKAFPVAEDPYITGNWDTPRCCDAIDAWNLRRADTEYEDLMKSVLEAVTDLRTLCHPEEVKE